VTVGVFLLLGLSPNPARAAEPIPNGGGSETPFKPIQVLEGAWRGDAEGEAGTGAVERTYEFVLGGRFLYEKNTSHYLPQEKNLGGEVHQHWAIFSYDGTRKRIVLRQFHQEGFVNLYVLRPELSTPTRLVFESESFENFSNAWRARESYDIVSPTEVVETFELGAPGKDLQVYSRTKLTRREPFLH